MTRILLARHGVSEGNLQGRFQGHQDIPISPQGEEQARRLAHRLQDEPITTIYTSDLQRAWRTAEIRRRGLIASDNCSLSCIEWDDARPTAAFWNDVSHLEQIPEDASIEDIQSQAFEGAQGLSWATP